MASPEPATAAQLQARLGRVHAAFGRVLASLEAAAAAAAAAPVAAPVAAATPPAPVSVTAIRLRGAATAGTGPTASAAELRLQQRDASEAAAAEAAAAQAALGAELAALRDAVRTKATQQRRVGAALRLRGQADANARLLAAINADTAIARRLVSGTDAIPSG